jgi:hypothetical protein
VKKFITVFVIAGTIFIAQSCSTRGPQGPAGPDAAGGYQAMMFQDGLYPSGLYAGCADTRIESGANADVNYGTYTYLETGYNGTEYKRALIKFDVTGLPAAAVVEKAEATLYCGSVATGSPQFAFYRVTWSDWNETEATWVSSTVSATWPDAGGVYDSSTATAYKAPGTGKYISWELDPAMLQDWINNPGNNFGLILISKGNEIGECVFASSQAAVAAQRPELTVYYTLP